MTADAATTDIIGVDGCVTDGGGARCFLPNIPKNGAQHSHPLLLLLPIAQPCTTPDHLRDLFSTSMLIEYMRASSRTNPRSEVEWSPSRCFIRHGRIIGSSEASMACNILKSRVLRREKYLKNDVLVLDIQTIFIFHVIDINTY
jgi:hypothetical protein